jgi:Sec-independent protein translocase protein TatA
MYDSDNMDLYSGVDNSGSDASNLNNGEDLLLVQIDAFRDKALKLQSLINAREKRVKELEALVRTKEAKNLELQQTLYKKQKEADSLVTDVNMRVGGLIGEVREAMKNIEGKLQTQVENNENSSVKQTMAVQDTLTSMNEGLTDLKSEISDKVHSENVKVYRNIQDLLTEKDRTDEATEVINEGFKGVKAQNTFLVLMSILNLGALVVAILLQLGII